MKNFVQTFLPQLKTFMRKNALLMISVKVLKLVLVIFLMSCGSSTESSKTPDTILIDSTDASLPGDTTKINYDEELEESEEEEEDNPIAPQES